MGITKELDKQFGIGAQLCFKQLPGGLVVAQIDNSLATATISLHGGQVVSWLPKHQTMPVLWVSKEAQFTPGKAIRGGVPICWPWFGAHPTDAKLPGHGYARISPWEVTSVCTVGSGATEISMTMLDTDLSCAHWSFPVRLSVRIMVGDSLEIALTTTNEGDRDIVFSEGLHTYFQVGNIADTQVFGLGDCEYVDLVSDNLRRRQVGPITFAQELGRIYLNTESACVIEDARLSRRIRINKSGSLSTAVWNPWKERAEKMGDLGPNGWQKMVCVESANALDNLMTLEEGASHTLTVAYTVESII